MKTSLLITLPGLSLEIDERFDSRASRARIFFDTGGRTHGTFLAILSRVSDILSLVTMAAAAGAITASVANLSVSARRHARAIGISAVAHFATPSRQTIADTAFALATSAADLKRTKRRQDRRV